jgi:hypothetical protein
MSARVARTFGQMTFWWPKLGGHRQKFRTSTDKFCNSPMVGHDSDIFRRSSKNANSFYSGTCCVPSQIGVEERQIPAAPGHMRSKKRRILFEQWTLLSCLFIVKEDHMCGVSIVNPQTLHGTFLIVGYFCKSNPNDVVVCVSSSGKMFFVLLHECEVVVETVEFTAVRLFRCLIRPVEYPPYSPFHCAKPRRAAGGRRGHGRCSGDGGRWRHGC